MIKSGHTSSFGFYKSAMIIQYRCPACQSTTLNVIENDGPPRVIDGSTKDYYNAEDMECGRCRHAAPGSAFFWRSESLTTPEAFHAVCDRFEQDEVPLQSKRHRDCEIVLRWEGLKDHEIHVRKYAKPTGPD